MSGGRARGDEAVPGPDVVAPRRSLDGWTLEGTALGARFTGEELRELGTLMHGVSAGMDTPWTYERAADILEAGGERPQALAVLDAYFALPSRIHDANPVSTRALARRRQRLRKRLGVRVPDAVDLAVDTADDDAEVPASRAGEVQALADLDVAAFAKAGDAGATSGSGNGTGTRAAGASGAAAKTGTAPGGSPNGAGGAGASAGSPPRPAGPSAARRGLAAAKRKSKAVGRVIAAKAAAAAPSAGPASAPDDDTRPELPQAPTVIPPRPASPPPPIDGTAPIPRKPERGVTDIPLPPKPATPPPVDDAAEPDPADKP
ncbi:hypothetical protein [Yinghuangia aomiensis]